MKIELSKIKRMSKKQRKAFIKSLSSLELLQVMQAIKQDESKRANAFEYERNIFAKCKGTRMRKRVRWAVYGGVPTTNEISKTY